ncbi:bifunctional diaminohydroxyphosphoribosylaminopyrimidine deaminase/5-amino-6-(5-phosphoribosylamino)uracil reductase RibD [Rhodococcus sp. P1Y]|uniref:bifunctional diaminohydroxyphosphoribosylaminopyrimidine deaminase/5-amino-6-(5-phosphoribosylamino)uracil reductase RibD n=1 Tax=Rhodococcus sp. P1Y TaxID=1302308 RepID=UPI000EB4C3C3|nr:bifunctional diaminohydroxyphosphoribosylaminopyrimidine deaminase/5-amino-6-(5-phosphoribosylamino)uracil reductase RibD [Rhodococcus sp. P1Y]AYJ49653.1 bifunctional diaminohydroxyphosphoribosylaminopyrimidine deaminase/5-amino-6-(5-phosphoribosylamino)uracil reductase RibD [Rhodococcus sp. P1Y]
MTAGARVTEAEAMTLAVDASEVVRGRTSPNPPVGAVVLDVEGRVVGVGATHPPGGPHAEVVALQQAGQRARGGTAIVTLEPCNHTGRTGPCSQALVEAGIARVIFAVSDPNPVAEGGARTLTDAGVDVESGLASEDVSRGPLRAWLHKQRTGRPHVTLKYAASLDGRSAAEDGTSQWITGPAARAHVHAQRATLDAIVVGTGTVEADDPLLTARLPDGTNAEHQPVRVVVGEREIDGSARIRNSDAPTLFLRTRDPHSVIEALGDHTDVLVEGGPRLAGAFLAAGLVDRIVAYIAPVILGSGAAAVENAGVGTISDARRFRIERVLPLGSDIVVDATPIRDEHAASPSGLAEEE